MRRVRSAMSALVILFRTTLLVSMVLLPPWVSASQSNQTQTQQDQPAGQAAGQEADTDETDTESESTDGQSQNELPDIDNQPIQPGSGGPGRFIPSEQISQDLGVSFPVDI